MAFRFPVGRYVFCPAFQHNKDVKVCAAQPYEDCQGCGVRRDDRERYGSRTFRIVESKHPPQFETEFVQIGDARKPKKPTADVSEAGALNNAFARLSEGEGNHGNRKEKKRRKRSRRR